MSTNRRVEPTFNKQNSDATQIMPHGSDGPIHQQHASSETQSTKRYHSLPLDGMNYVPPPRKAGGKLYPEERLPQDIIFIAVIYLLFGLSSIAGLAIYPAQTIELFQQFMGISVAKPDVPVMLPFPVEIQAYIIISVYTAAGLFLAFGTAIGWGLAFLTLIFALTSTLLSLYLNPIDLGPNWLPASKLDFVHSLILCKLAVVSIIIILFCRRRVLRYFNVTSRFSIFTLLSSVMINTLLFFNALGLINLKAMMAPLSNLALP